MEFDEINSIITNRATSLQTRANMLNGNMWADGAGWVGPTGAPGGGTDSPASSLILDEIRKGFISQNVLREVTSRHAAGVMGLAPFITTSPPEEEPEEDSDVQTLAQLLAVVDEDAHLVGGWLADNKVHAALLEAAQNSLWAAPEDNQKAAAPLRAYIPAGELEDDGTLPLLPFEESLARVKVHAPAPEKAGVIRDADGQPLIGWYAYTETVDGDDVEMLELSVLRSTLDNLSLDLEGDLSAAATAQPDDTLILQVTAEDGTVTSGAAHNLGGLLTITEVVREPLITDAAISLQKLVNLAWTMMGRNTVLAGFLERIIMGAMPPGKWVNTNGDEVAPGTTGAVFEPTGFSVGPATATFLSGVPHINAQGDVTGYSTPSVYDRQPVSPQTLIETKNESRAGILQECAQIHTLIAGDATASGASREQALQDFSMSLDLTVTALRDAGNDIITAAVRLAAFFASDRQEYAEAEVHLAPRKNLMVTDEAAADEDDVDAALARDRVFAARVKQALELAAEISEETGQTVPWQILLVGNATNSAPAGFLSGAVSLAGGSTSEEQSNG